MPLDASGGEWNLDCRTWSGQGEADYLISTRHCDGLRRCWRNVISAQCSECQSDEIQTGAAAPAAKKNEKKKKNKQTRPRTRSKKSAPHPQYKNTRSKKQTPLPGLGFRV